MKTLILSSLVCCNARVTSSLFGMGIPSPVSWQVGICRVPLPAGLRAGWGFLLGSPLPVWGWCRLQLLLHELCPVHFESFECTVEKPSGRAWERCGKSRDLQGRPGEGKGKSQSNSMGKRQWSEWCLVMGMYLTESGKITKCSNVFCFLPTFHSLSSSCSLNYHGKNEPRNDWVMK